MRNRSRGCPHTALRASSGHDFGPDLEPRCACTRSSAQAAGAGARDLIPHRARRRLGPEIVDLSDMTRQRPDRRRHHRTAARGRRLPGTRSTLRGQIDKALTSRARGHELNPTTAPEMAWRRAAEGACLTARSSRRRAPVRRSSVFVQQIAPDAPSGEATLTRRGSCPLTHVLARPLRAQWALLTDTASVG